MKLDTDPGRAREFEVLAIVILLALAGASLSDFLRAPTWTPLVDASLPADDGGCCTGILVEPWVPQAPERESDR
ncbi:hypothetical protein [Variovorax sp. YR216]|uniref:hypothetical protein n=1 Tax=Variovorax sp. YR216 TaxID=1882828 RepID=UPI000899B635|nr:hypothetical protein [Variovorax sp. YR216]SEB05707.1 hypothetical protein SAMN05444680_106174 [Variovorax sp. YR216]